MRSILTAALALLFICPSGFGDTKESFIEVLRLEKGFDTGRLEFEGDGALSKASLAAVLNHLVARSARPRVISFVASLPSSVQYAFLTHLLRSPRHHAAHGLMHLTPSLTSVEAMCASEPSALLKHYLESPGLRNEPEFLEAALPQILSDGLSFDTSPTFDTLLRETVSQSSIDVVINAISSYDPPGVLLRTLASIPSYPASKLKRRLEERAVEDGTLDPGLRAEVIAKLSIDPERLQKLKELALLGPDTAWGRAAYYGVAGNLPLGDWAARREWVTQILEVCDARSRFAAALRKELRNWKASSVGQDGFDRRALPILSRCARYLTSWVFGR